MIRPTIPADSSKLHAITEETGLFSPIDMQALDEVLEDYHKENEALGHRCVTYEKNGEIIGFAYYGPAPMTDRTWYLWWIVVTKRIQARGIGSELLRHFENAVRAHNGRLMLLETSSLPTYELTRKFYVKNHYEVAGIIKDYYADNHDMYIFRKRV